ncbi:hypothetical protein SDC9_180752 [bioreactor metagenome]|uniref:Uncharacterized protein n=1 Tax=bioreactor metagenome TaxID=1076179 RepID=A0A645H2M4_9ZZZZ
MPLRPESRHPSGDILDALRAAHRGAAILLNYQCHRRIQVLVDKARDSIESGEKLQDYNNFVVKMT